MFNRKSPESLNPAAPASPFTMEGLEDRRLLSGQSHSSIAHPPSSGPPASVHYRGNTILFSQAPPAVRNGLTALATTAGLTPPMASQAVSLSKRNGVEAYTVKVGGASTSLTVDVNGNPIGAVEGDAGGGGCVGGGFGIDFGRGGQLGLF
jgi:hypothetical protein